MNPEADRLRDLLLSPKSHGVGAIHAVAREPFWDETALPFTMHGGGNVVRVVPTKGFRRDNLAGSEDERLLIVDCPDAEGWLVPAGFVASWMARHVTNPDLDDLLIGHPLYSHTTKVDAKGHSVMGKGRLVHWSPEAPTSAFIAEPPFLPNDRKAPAVNRLRRDYADAVVDLLDHIRQRFDVVEIEVSARLG